MAPCLPATPHPMPGQSRAAAAASLHFGAWGGGGEALGASWPLSVLCHLGLVPQACSLKGPGLLFSLPFCSLELGDDACLAPIFLPASSLPLLLPCNGSPFWHLLPCPLPEVPISLSNLPPSPLLALQPSLLPGSERWGARHGGTKGFWVLMCVLRGHMLQGSSCRLPRGWQSGAAGKGGREDVDPPISDRLLSASGPPGDQGGHFCPSPEPGLPKGRLRLWDAPSPLPQVPSKASRFPLSSLELRWETKLHVGHSCPQRAKGLWRNRFIACTPPPPQPAARASLGTKQSLLSNFKCYLRTAWPQPKTALWKLAFRCRGCKYQRHTFGGGGVCFDASPPSAAGAGPEWAHRHTEAAPTEGHTQAHDSCGPQRTP